MCHTGTGKADKDTVSPHEDKKEKEEKQIADITPPNGRTRISDDSEKAVEVAGTENGWTAPAGIDKEVEVPLRKKWTDSKGRSTSFGPADIYTYTSYHVPAERLAKSPDRISAEETSVVVKKRSEESKG